MLEVGVPGNEAAQVSADVGEHQELVIIQTHNEHPVAVDRLLPSIDDSAGVIKRYGRLTNRIVLERSHRNPRFGFLGLYRWRDQVTNGWDADDGSHDRPEE